MNPINAVALAAAMLTAACVAVERRGTPQFETVMSGSGEMEFRFSGNAADTEEVRMQQLEEFLHANRLCAQGYEIAARTPAPDGRILYSGSCSALQCW